MLDPVAHLGLRLALGAFKTSPKESLYTEAGEPPLKLRREKLAIQYALKLSSHPENPTYKCVFNPQYETLYKPKKNPVFPFGFRIRPILKDIDLQNLDPETEGTPEIPPWTLTLPSVNFEITTTKKSDTAEVLYLSKFNEIKDKHSTYKPIYTDGSKTEAAVAAAAVNGEKTISKAFNKNLSIFSAEIKALEIALNEINTSNENRFIIFSDSKSALEAIKNLWTPNPLVRRLLELHHEISKSKHIIFCWVPSHVGIKGNETADRAAKAALDSPVSDPKVPASDWLPKSSLYIKTERKKQWDNIQTNKLKEIVPDLTEHHQLHCTKRRDEVVLTRLRIGHTRLTHAFLLKGEIPPECIGCNTSFTIKHILIDCIDFADTRKLYYNVPDMFTLFRTVTPGKILEFIREIGLYSKI